MKRHLLVLPFMQLLVFVCLASGSNLRHLNATTAMAITDGFITTWQTSSDGQEILIPVNSEYTGSYNYSVDWGDGTSSTGQTGDAAHIYALKGTYSVTITGNFPAIKFGSGASADANDALLRTVVQWGNGTWSGMDAAFKDCVNLTAVPNANGPVFAANSTLYCMFYNCSSLNGDLNLWNLENVRETSCMFYNAVVFNGNISDWDVANVTNMEQMFYGAKAFNGDISRWNVAKVTLMGAMFNLAASFNGNIGNWDVGQVTNMSGMFTAAASFDADISHWNVGQVTNMGGMFNGAASFNSDIGGWNVSRVTDMQNMFNGASSFNGAIDNWNVGQVTDMLQMFSAAKKFNAAIGNWNVSHVTNMAGMFSSALSFDADISGWDVGEVTDMNEMFLSAAAFNRDLGQWNVSKVINMSRLFFGAKSFNGDIADWHVGQVTDMSEMFVSAFQFNGNIADWDVSNVTTMRSMFSSALSFDADISKWNVSKVVDMYGMFNLASSFNQDISRWDVGSVQNMGTMFSQARAFDQNIGGWNIENVLYMEQMLNWSGLSVQNYEAALKGWAGKSVKRGSTLGAVGLKYCSVAARTILMTEDGWQIDGDRNVCLVPAFPDSAGIVYVDSSVAVGGDGSSWSRALHYLSNAVESARSNPDITAIHIAKGTYYPAGDSNPLFPDSTFVIMRSDLQLLGGYPSGGGVRDPNGNTTILSGDLGIQGDTSDNSLAIMLIDGIARTDSLIVDGFSFSQNNMRMSPLAQFEGYSGAMIIIGAYDNTVIRNCKFLNNFGIGCAALSIYGLNFDDGDGGDSIVLANPQISDCLFTANTLTDPYADLGYYLDGGALYSYQASAFLNHCDFVGNTGYHGAAVVNDASSNLIFYNCRFLDNEAYYCPVLINESSDKSDFINCLIKGNINHAAGIGSLTDFDQVFSNAVIGNFYDSKNRLLNTTVVGNGLSQVQSSNSPLIVSMFNETDSIPDPEPYNFVTNSIIWGNRSNRILDSLGIYPSGISYSLIEGRAEEAKNHNPDGIARQDLFVDAANGDYRLSQNSSAIDAGFPDSLLVAVDTYTNHDAHGGLDLAGNVRMIGSSIDLGAYESDVATLPVEMSLLRGRLNAQGHATLSWSTYTELDNKGFEVQVSTDGISFSDLGFVHSLAADGNSVSELSYSFDAGLLTTARYYRLIQVGESGRSSLSNVVKLGSSVAFQLKAYPNPVQNVLHLQIAGDPAPHGRIRIVDYTGKLVHEEIVSGKTDELNVDLQGLASGIYMVSYKDDNNHAVIRVVKQ